MIGLLVGYGSIGRRHLTNLHVLGVDDWAVVHTGAGSLPFEPPCRVRTYASLAGALDIEEPTFAVVANPTAMHVSAARACVARGCDLLLEKPVSHNLHGLAELAREATAHDVRVLVGFQFRFHPAMSRIARSWKSRQLACPFTSWVVWGEFLPDWHPWEDWRTSYAARRDLGGGVHHTLCHPFDYLRMLFGEVTGLVASLTDHGPLGLDVAEAADVALRFRSGVTANVHLDYWSRPATHRVEIVATEGTIVWDHHAGELRIWNASTSVWRAELVPGADAARRVVRVGSSALPRCNRRRGEIRVHARRRDRDRAPLCCDRAGGHPGREPVDGGAVTFGLGERVIIITGGGGFLALEFARALAGAGARPVLADIDGGRAEANVTELRDEGLEALAVEADITKPNDTVHLVTSVVDRLGRLDGLLNGAAIDPKFEPGNAGEPTAAFEHYPLAQWQQSLDVNLTGTFLVTQAASRHFLAQDRGVIVNVASIYGTVGPDQRLYAEGDVLPPSRFKPVDYSVTKSALYGFTRYLAAYFAGTGIRANSVTFGGINHGHDESFRERYGRRLPMGRMGEPG